YTPADVGADVGNLDLTSDDNNNPQTVDVPLAGNGVEPPVNACNFSVAPTSLAFGPVTIGANSTLSTTVTNNGTAACNMTASVAAGEFTLASGATFTVAANGGTASVSVSYAPVDLGADTGNLSLASDDATNPQTVTVPLSGSGVDVAACDGITFTQAEWRTQGNGQLRVRGTGVRDGIIELFAFDPAEIIDTSRGNNGRFNFNVRNLAAVPCRVRVLQPEEGLCGEADIDNAGDDCLPLGPFVPPVEPDPLTARGDTYATPVGNPITVTAGRLSGVLYNDFGGVAPLTAQLVSGPSAGTLALGTDGGFTYTPDGSMVDNSLDQFTYVAVDADGVSSDPTTVTIQTLSKQVDFKITMNYELGMHCTGFEFAYCCVLPPYNSIVSQVIKPAQGDAAANEEEDFVDGFPRLLEGDPNVGRDGLNRETVVRDWDHNDNSFKKYQLRYYHDAQPRQEGNTGKPNESTLISAAEGNSLQYFNTVFDSAQPDPLTNALIYGPYNGVENVVQGSGVIGDVPTDNYANGWLNHFYIYIDPDTGGPNLEGHGATGAEADKIRLGVAGQVQYPANAGAGLQPLGPTGTVPAGFENVLTFSGGTGTVVYTQAKVLEDLPIMLTSPRIWEALGLPLTPFEDTIGFFADPGAVDEDVVRPYVAMKASLHDFATGDAIMGSNGQPVIGFGTAPIDIPNCERCHSAPSINPDTGMPSVNSPNWNRPDAFYPHPTGTVPVGTGLEDMTNLE
ncbi:MAG: choice-of-anchor D domain-containing protein, partial [Thiogranum sp.]